MDAKIGIMVLALVLSVMLADQGTVQKPTIIEVKRTLCLEITKKHLLTITRQFG